jgi:hypothetical protein
VNRNSPQSTDSISSLLNALETLAANEEEKKKEIQIEMYVIHSFIS